MPQSIEEIRRKERERSAAKRARDRDGVNARKRAWSKAEKAKTSKKRWNLAHPESVRATGRKRIRLNRQNERDTLEKAEAANARTRKWYNKNIIVARERGRLKQRILYRAKDPEIFRTYNRKRRASKLSAEGSHSLSDTKRIRLAQGNRCAYCRLALGRNGHLDHIVALSKGGSNWPRNLQWLCVSCNTSKKAKDPIEFAQSKGMLL